MKKGRITLHKYLLALLISVPCLSLAQVKDLRSPLDIPLSLSGNFGELRSNHFHSGIDFKTQQVQGKTVHAVADGYISRIAVSPWGYGNVIYINHPNGLTTVYAHLQGFEPAIAEYVRERQYAQESFSVNLMLRPEQFPIKRGDVIGKSGNSGSSGGPHLHFEIRHTVSEYPIDPLMYYRNRIKDSRRPRIDAFMVYPMQGSGSVNGSSRKKEFRLVADKQGRRYLNGNIEAWGDIGLAVKAYDYMDGTSNIYGVKNISLEVDGTPVFRSDIDSFSLDGETRYINSFIDYEEWSLHRSFFMKSFVEPGNRLNFLRSNRRGIISINEERDYHISYRLSDVYGNQARCEFVIRGKKQTIAPIDTADRTFFHWKGDNRFGARGVRLLIPDGNLYSDLWFRYSKVPKGAHDVSDIHNLGDKPLAMQNNAILSIRILADLPEATSQYGIVKLNRNDKPLWIGGAYNNGWIQADIRELGSYTIMTDSLPPTILPVRQKSWRANKTITFRISDNLSGISYYRGEIDGKFALFEFDGKRGIVACRLDNLAPAARHRLSFVLVDSAGNRSVFNASF
jgi:hypothetical protein